jgi:glycosyltransferase involved in cell wall biosynthesis
MLIPGKMEGIGYFTLETMKLITTNHPEHDFLFIFDRPSNNEFIFSKNIQAHSVFPPARHPLLWYLWYEWSLPNLFKKTRPDLFISTDGYISLSSSVKTLAVIHDLNFEHYPKDLPLFNRLYYRYFFPKYAERSNRIAAVSEFTKNDIVKTYSIPASKIDVVYNGANENFKPVTEEIKLSIRKKFSSGHPYFLFVGALHQRKNIANLLRAFEEFKNTVSTPMKLLLIGQKRWWTKEMEEVYSGMKHREEVILTGRVSEDDLYAITASAFAVTYVSVFEGFGIPIVEAMKCNVPVITSNVTSMPEIAGDSALLCDPHSYHSISEAMVKLHADKALRNSFIEKGKHRQNFFSWEKSAEELWNCVEKLV